MFEHPCYFEPEKLLFSHIPVLMVKGERFSKLSTDAKLLYGILLSMTEFSSRNGWFDEKGCIYVFYTVKEAMEDLGCANQKATKLFKELEKIGLIEKKRQPNRPAIVYVKNFTSVSCSENQNSGLPKTGSPEFRKPESNNIDINNIDINNNLSIYQEERDGWIGDGISSSKIHLRSPQKRFAPGVFQSETS